MIQISVAKVMYPDINDAALRRFGGVTQAVFSLDNISFPIMLKIRGNNVFSL